MIDRKLRYVMEHDEKTCAVHFTELPELVKMIRNKQKKKEVSKCFTILCNNWGVKLSLQKLVGLCLRMLVHAKPRNVLKIIELSGAVDAEDHDEYIQRLKKVTETLRKTLVAIDEEGNLNYDLSVEEICAYCYLEHTSGRIETVYDEEKEIDNRTRNSIRMLFPIQEGSRVWTEQAYDDKFKETARRVASRVVGHCGASPKKDFEKRASWDADGVTQVSWSGVIRKGGKRREVDIKLRRKAALSTMTWEKWLREEYNKMEEELEMFRPTLIATASNKYENGKGRLLLSGDIDSFIRQQLIAGRFERCLQYSDEFAHPRKDGEGARNLLKFMKEMHGRDKAERSTYLASIDWSDFNLHLKPKHQMFLWQAIWERVGKDTENAIDYEDAQRIFEIELEALSSQKIKFDEKTYDVVQGESSGIRLTDTFNSIGNLKFRVKFRPVTSAARLSDTWPRASVLLGVAAAAFLELCLYWADRHLLCSANRSISNGYYVDKPYPCVDPFCT